MVAALDAVSTKHRQHGTDVEIGGLNEANMGCSSG